MSSKNEKNLRQAIKAAVAEQFPQLLATEMHKDIIKQINEQTKVAMDNLRDTALAGISEYQKESSKTEHAILKQVAEMMDELNVSSLAFMSLVEDKLNIALVSDNNFKAELEERKKEVREAMVAAREGTATVALDAAPLTEQDAA